MQEIAGQAEPVLIAQQGHGTLRSCDTSGQAATGSLAAPPPLVGPSPTGTARLCNGVRMPRGCDSGQTKG